MKKSGWIILIVAAVLVIFGVTTYNSMVKHDEGVGAAWSNVENQYQRRADLVPNLVATVKGYAAHESATLQQVVEARAKATQLTVSADQLTEENLRSYQQAQGELSQALGRLMAISEAYPDLKANQNFLELQAQLEGTENRIAVERRTFNNTAQEYNKYIRRFPNNLIASMFGFEHRPYFQAEEGSEKAPVVEF